jgi:hypothetical protein
MSARTPIQPIARPTTVRPPVPTDSYGAVLTDSYGAVLTDLAAARAAFVRGAHAAGVWGAVERMSIVCSQTKTQRGTGNSREVRPA